VRNASREKETNENSPVSATWRGAARRGAARRGEAPSVQSVRRVRLIFIQANVKSVVNRSSSFVVD
jgi:hypothetical protein